MRRLIWLSLTNNTSRLLGKTKTICHHINGRASVLNWRATDPIVWRRRFRYFITQHFITNHWPWSVLSLYFMLAPVPPLLWSGGSRAEVWKLQLSFRSSLLVLLRVFQTWTPWREGGCDLDLRFARGGSIAVSRWTGQLIHYGGVRSMNMNYARRKVELSY